MKIDLNQHQTKAAVVFCVDFRFVKPTLQLIDQELGIKLPDIFTIPGAGKGFAEDSAYSRCVMYDIGNVSVKLHDIDEIYIFSHEDCGAYGSSQAFANLVEEKVKIQADLMVAREKMVVAFPDQLVRIGWVTAQGAIEMFN